MMMKVNIRTIVTLVVTFSACIISQDNVATAINIRGGDIDGLPPITALPKWCPEPSRLFISKHPDYDNEYVALYGSKIDYYISLSNIYFDWMFTKISYK